MTFRHFKQGYQRLIFFVFVCMLPLTANYATEEVITEKQMEVAMRLIGHEILMCLGDYESRVMPIEKIDEYYKIPFEFEFGFDPDDIIEMISRIMEETKIGTHYLVEVEQCETKKIVHGFMIGNAANSDVTPCKGRALPKDCYSLLITILDRTSFSANLEPNASNGSSLVASEPRETNLFKSAFLIFPLLFLIGFIGFFIKKKSRADIDPNLILVGASQFDKRSSILSFENNSVELSNKESELLALLHASANVPIEREVILQKVWGDEGGYVGRTLDVFISKLRKKLEADASVKIVNIRGVGYKLVIDVPKQSSAKSLFSFL